MARREPAANRTPGSERVGNQGLHADDTFEFSPATFYCVEVSYCASGDL